LADEIRKICEDKKAEEEETEDEGEEEQEQDEDIAQAPPDPVNQDKMPTTPAAPKRSAKSSAKKRVVAVDDDDDDDLAGQLSSLDLYDDGSRVNETRPMVFAFSDNETLLVKGFPVLFGMEKGDTYRFDFSDDGTIMRMLCKVTKDARTPEGLLDGFANCQEGSQWHNMAKQAIKELYGGMTPGTPSGDSEWKVFMSLKLPFPVDKIYYEPGVSSLVPKQNQVVSMQLRGDILTFNCFLRKKFIDNHKRVVKGYDTAGKASQYFAQFAAASPLPQTPPPPPQQHQQPCKFRAYEYLS
jgi:hypothetical protein